MNEPPLTIEQILNLFAAAPVRLAALTAGLVPDQLHTPLEPGEWSARDMLAHLRACSDVWGKSIATILNEDKPILRGVNPRVWMKKTNVSQRPPAGNTDRQVRGNL